jgi:hypothetical protein
MGLNRDKFRKIVGGITTPEVVETNAAESIQPAQADAEAEQTPAVGRGSESPVKSRPEDRRRFAMRGRPKGQKDEPPATKTRKVKVSLFLPEDLVNDLYDWAHDDKIHPGEMFERALTPFHEREAKRRAGRIDT